ncbi:MAG: BatA domain-containing protein [Flavobacteriaceae bacterium]
MLFKYPELLWALFLLLIPIFIHLFQLRKFKKTPFTNVKMLQKVISESGRSNTIKKWLLLLTRLGMLTVLIIAFAQPFFAEKSALKQKETIIYLDDSFSMQLKTDRGTLLEDAIQSLVKSIPKNNLFSLFTNKKVFKNVSIQDIQNDILRLEPTIEQLNLNEISLKAATLFSSDPASQKNLVIISDFQKRMASKIIDSSNTIKTHLIQLATEKVTNISIDSVYLSDTTSENIEITALLSSTLELESTPVSLFNDEKLIAKTSAVFNTNKKASVHFTIPEGQSIKGKIEISDTGLAYDNLLYFNINQKEKIKVLAIGSADSDYLQRIYSEDEFQFSHYALKNLNYGTLDDQNLILLNELPTISSSLSVSLKSFTDAGGSLVIIPANDIDLNTYNTLLTQYYNTRYLEPLNRDRNITDITFSHPLYQSVFEKKISNFQYPKVSQYLKIKTIAPKILSFQDGDPFLVGSENFYLFTASLASDNSNFKRSPLIVPTFYTMGHNSLKLARLYEIIGDRTRVDVSFRLPKDNILSLSNKATEFIPRQRSLTNKVSLTFHENTIAAGSYAISSNDTHLKNISFNYPREESELHYLNLQQLKTSTKEKSIATFFQNEQKDSTITELWKWFIILAVFFITVEMLIQKYYK